MQVYYYQQWVDLLCAKQQQQQQSLSNVCTVAVLIVWLCVLCVAVKMRSGVGNTAVVSVLSLPPSSHKLYAT